MRFKYHRARLFTNYNMILEERKKIKNAGLKDKLTKNKSQLNITSNSIKGSYCPIPLSITKNKYTSQDFSMLTTMQNEENKTVMEKNQKYYQNLKMIQLKEQEERLRNKEEIEKKIKNAEKLNLKHLKKISKTFHDKTEIRMEKFQA
mmetsp:Transcript_3390/g.3346  ORF Transcript_3390/g.3346 Transcript_3390/m.3346 type:complete len:147 (-) Transcript_3390:929-1369(-)